MVGPNPGLAPTFGKCSQCGKFHPPVAGTCPMAKPKDPESIEKIEIEKFLNNMRVQLQVKMKILNIKDHSKLYLYLSTELNKLMENYKE